jgi:hypothetical protein
MIEGKPLLPEGSPFELWDVRLKSGDVKLSIDELDAAFESGLVDRNTLVRRRGTVRWVTLAEAANLEPEEAPAPPAAVTPRPAIPRPSVTPAPRRTSPPPLPPSVAAPAPLVSPAPPPPLTVVVESAPVPAPVERPLEPLPHVSSLPPPVAFSTAPSTAFDDFRPKQDSLEDTAAAIAALHPRSNRKRLAALFVLTLIGAAAVTVVKFPSVRHVIATSVQRLNPSAPAANGVAAAAPPPAASAALPPPSAVPAPSAAPSAAPPAPSSAASTHPAAATSSAKIVSAPAKPSRTTKAGAKSGAAPHH